MGARSHAAALLLAALVAGCGETLVDHAGAGILGNAGSCGEGQVTCDGVCVTQSPSQCSTSCSPCPAAPANATAVCTPVGPGGHDGTCDFTCDAGLLRCGAGCCAPALVAAGGAFSCATTTTGEVHCFGAGDAGQLGNGGPAVDRATSAVVRGFGAPVTALAAGGAHACAISGGQTLCWGNGAAFASGAGAVLDPAPVAALAGATAISAGASHTCGLVAGQAVCVGSAAEAGGGTPALGGTALAVAAGDRFSCALVDAGAGGSQVKCWGRDEHGQLGGGVAGTSSSTPVTVGPAIIASTATHLAAGARHACAGTEAPDGNAALWCWGDNTGHQLGDAAATLLGPTLNGRVKKPIVGLAGGDHATCAVEDDAPAYVLSCWSSDPLLAAVRTGEPNQVVSAPHAAGLHGFSAGGAHVCYVDAIQTPPRLRCFGTGSRGRLGNGSTADSLAPVLVVDR